jgi:hypothetical protein
VFQVGRCVGGALFTSVAARSGARGGDDALAKLLAKQGRGGLRGFWADPKNLDLISKSIAATFWASGIGGFAAWKVFSE